MKISSKKLFLVSTLIASLNLMPTDLATAQTYTNVHVFTNSPNDGANPQAGLILSGNTLYGTTASGGQSGAGTVFKVNTDGSNPTNFYSFKLPSFPNFPHTNSDGAFPAAAVVLSGNTVYGTTYEGGVFGYGTVFRVNTDGSDFTNIHSFTTIGFNGNSDGANPQAGLVLSGNRLYGTASQGGTNDAGTVFALNTDGSHFTNLYNFTGSNDGSFPSAGLLLSGNTLYGTVANGGTNDNGALFSIHTDGSDFTNLYSFSAGDFNDEDDITNSDGGFPKAGLILSGSTLYGTSSGGGLGGVGTVFAINTDGSGFTNLYSFTDNGGGNDGPNSDGAVPLAGLLLVGNSLYGTANQGGTSGFGTVFAVNTDGSNFTNLFNFDLTVNDIGGFPYGGLVLSGSALYGTTYSGGFQYGVVFSLSGTLPVPPSAPVLAITRSGTNVILSWPEIGYVLESTTNLASPIVWAPVTGQNAVTNPIAAIPQKFFRLSSTPAQ